MSSSQSNKVVFNPKIPTKLQKELQRLLALVMYESLSKLEKTNIANMKDFFYLHLHGESLPLNGNEPIPLPSIEMSEATKLFRGIGHYSVLWDVSDVNTIINGLPTVVTTLSLKKKFLLCAQPLSKVTIGKELHSELMLQSSSIVEYKRLGATTILGHKKETMKNSK